MSKREKFMMVWLLLLSVGVVADKLWVSRSRVVRTNRIEVLDHNGNAAITLDAYGLSSQVAKSWPRIVMRGEGDTEVNLGMMYGRGPMLKLVEENDMAYVDVGPRYVRLASTDDEKGAGTRYFGTNWAVRAPADGSVELDVRKN